jgi:hypothetical protein
MVANEIPNVVCMDVKLINFQANDYWRDFVKINRGPVVLYKGIS